MPSFEDYAVLRKLAPGGYLDPWLDTAELRIRPGNLAVDAERVRSLASRGLIASTISEMGTATYRITQAGEVALVEMEKLAN